MCGCAEPARWHADARFTEEERVEIERGFAWLQEVSGRDLGGVDFRYEVTTPDPLPHTIRRERAAYLDRGATGLCTVTPGGAIYLDPIGLPDEGMRLDRLAGLTAHELAHCELGMADDPETGGIMRVIEPMRWTERETAQLLRRDGIVHPVLLPE